MELISTALEDLSPVELTHCAQQFLAWESKLLDERRFEEWYALLDDDLHYEVPLKEAKQVKEEETPKFGYRIRDEKSHVRIRINRLSTGHAWAEMPVSRTLRTVGSVLVQRTEDKDVIAVESALILYRQRGHENLGDIIPVRRQDLLKMTDKGLVLLKRVAHIAEVTLSTPNLGVFV